MVTDGNEKMPKNIGHICERCFKEYKHSSGLSRHMKTCKVVMKPFIHEQNEISAAEPVIEHNNNSIKGDHVVELIRQNHEFKDLLIEQQKQNKHLQQQLIDVAKEGKTINNNCNQTNNFNLNLFLNEECKNAYNLIDFINSLQLSTADIQETGKLGYVDGIGRIFVNALKDLDVTERPIHCTDAKRETVYVKDQDKWGLENFEHTTLKSTLHAIEKKNLELLPAWKEENPDFALMDSKENTDFIQISLHAMGPENQTEKERQENKIIKNVLKEVVLDKKK